jgi:hypothetical protein
MLRNLTAYQKSVAEIQQQWQQSPPPSPTARNLYQSDKDIINKHQAQPEDMYNMDETGCCIGVAKNQYVYMRNKRTVIMPSANNHELITLVECVNATGNVIEPVIIIKAATLLENWVADMPDKYLIHKTESGYSTDETALDWLKHFNKMTWPRRNFARASGVFCCLTATVLM